MNIKKKDKVLSCFDVANYFLVLVDREAGDSITHVWTFPIMQEKNNT